MYQHLALSENGFLFNTKTGQTFSLNRTGVYILRKLIGGDSPSAIAAGIKDAFDVVDEVAEKDVEYFLYRLKDLNLVD